MGVLSRPRPGQNRRYAYGFASILARNTSRVGYPNHTHFIGQTQPLLVQPCQHRGALGPGQRPRRHHRRPRHAHPRPRAPAIHRRPTRAEHPARGQRAHEWLDLTDGLLDHRSGPSALGTVALLGASRSSKSAETFPCTSITRRAVNRSASARSNRARTARNSSCSGLGARGPRLRGANPSSAPASCCLRHAAKCDEYNPSRRNNTAISPGRVTPAASRKTRSLYSAVNRRRRGRSASSGSGLDPLPTRRARRAFRSARLRLPPRNTRHQTSPPSPQSAWAPTSLQLRSRPQGSVIKQKNLSHLTLAERGRLA